MRIVLWLAVSSVAFAAGFDSIGMSRESQSREDSRRRVVAAAEPARPATHYTERPEYAARLAALTANENTQKREAGEDVYKGNQAK